MALAERGIIMVFLGRLFGTKKAVENLTAKDGLLAKAGSWLGNFNYTDEEKAEMDAQTREWGFRQLDALAPFKVVQRIGFFAVCGMWLVVGANVLVAIWLNHQAKSEILAFAMSDYVFWPTVAVFSLYFTGGVFPRKGGS